MKYGETLQQRSIPQWQAYNVDYNEIKRLIKEHTSQTETTAIAIPGQQSHHGGSQFENELYSVLQEQHDTVDMFMRSKAGEIQRRLDHLYKIVVHMRRRTNGAVKKKVPVKRLEQYSRIENDALNIGDEVQSLARFVAAQEQAFLKLLKKYKKWTGSTSLAERFHRDVLSKPTRFSQAKITPLLSQYEDVLETLRAPFQAGLTWTADSADEDLQSILSHKNNGRGNTSGESEAAKELSSIANDGTNLELDVGLATIPLGDDAGFTSYWVHPENILQLHILVLQHARLRALDRSSSSPDPQTPRSSRKPSINDATSAPQLESENDIDLMCFDDLESFARRRSGMTIRDLETRPGRRLDEATASIRCSSHGNAVVCVQPSGAGQPGRSSKPVQIMRAHVPKKKLLRSVFDAYDTKMDLSPSNTSLDAPTEAASSQPWADSLREISNWYNGRPEVKPLVRVCAKRSRFIGLGNDSRRGVWITLDRDVSMLPFSLNDLDGASQGHPDLKRFPHAVLGVRWEGQACPRLVSILDHSHLVERIPGFSIEAHAVATICKPENMATPFWSHALQRDIRKIPANASRSRKGSTTPQSSGTRPTSMSASGLDGPLSSGFSKTQDESPPTSLPSTVEVPDSKTSKRKRRSRQSVMHQERRANRYDKSAPRYWNEFDDGDEALADEAYTILIDPNARDPLIELWSTVKKGATKMSENLHAVLGLSKTNDDPERQNLLPAEQNSQQHSVDSDDSDESPRPPVKAEPRSRPKFPSRYSTFPTFHQARDPLDPLSHHQIKQREMLLLRCTIGAFIASFLLLIVAAILEATRRKRYVVSADVGTIVGVIASIFFAIAGVGLSAARKDGGGVMTRIQVGLAFALILFGNGIEVLILVGG